MKVSKMATSVSASLTRKLFNMANEIGTDVINLTLGDPDLIPALEIREAACDAIMQGQTRYSANAGLKKLREVYSEFISREYNLSIDSDKNIITTVGGMEALFLSLAATVDKDDEVIILGPYYVNYREMIHMLGGKAVVVDTMNKSDDVIVDGIKSAINDKTIGIIVNSPCNPTGDILSGELLDSIAEIANSEDLMVISDEVYNSLIYDGDEKDSIIFRDGMKDRTILVDSCSKRFAMTGWRVGFAVGPCEVIANMTKLQENVAACAPLPSQHAAIRAYQEDCEYSYIRETYQHRRDIVYNAISKIPNLSCKKPKATFYCFVDISKTGLDSESFAYQLLEKAHLAVVPGVSYGKQYANYIRIAFTLNDDLLNEAMRRLEQFCGEL